MQVTWGLQQVNAESILAVASKGPSSRPDLVYRWLLPCRHSSERLSNCCKCSGHGAVSVLLPRVIGLGHAVFPATDVELGEEALQHISTTSSISTAFPSF